MPPVGTDTTTPAAADGATRPGPRRGEPRPFDFRRPNKLSRDHTRNLLIIHETFTGQFSTVLSSTLRVVSTMSVLSIEELTYDEYVRDLSVPTHLSFLSLDPLPGVALLQLPVPTAMVMVDLMLGGQGRPLADERPLTEIESGLIRTLLERALRDLAYAFESVVELTPAIVGQESNPQFAQIAAPSDMVVSVTFELQLATSRPVDPGIASICYPYDSLHPILEAVAGTVGQRTLDPRAAMETRERLADRMEAVPVEVSVEFSQAAMSSREIMAMRPGDLLALGHPADQTLVATAGGVPLFAVRPARRGKRVAAQVVSRLSDRTDPNRGIS